ncbi:MAG: glycosyltransferase family 4 protein [Gemmatimonadota bacterium]
MHLFPSRTASRPIPVHDLLFAFDFPPMGGGIARWMAELARGYPSGELTVSTGTLPGWEASDADQPNRIDRLPFPSSRLKTVPGMLRWSRRAGLLAADPSARFAWCGNVRPAGYPVRWAFERTGLPYGIIVHGGDLLTLRAKFAASPLKRRSYRPVLEAASVFVANSEWTAARCRELLTDIGLAEVAGRIRVVPLGTHPDRFRPDPVAAETFRLRRGLPAGRWLVTVARLVPHKGIDTAIALVAALLEAHPDVQYLVVGRGTQEAALRTLAESRGVADRVHILTDVTDDELPAAYALGEIYLGLSREAGLDAEGFGIALLEAAASGLPVVAGSSGGIADAVANGESGVLVDPADHQQAADAVRHLLGDSALAHGLGAAGRERVLQRFTWERVVSDLRAIASELGRQ